MQGAGSRPGRVWGHIFFCSTLVVVAATDQLTKLWIRANLPLGQSRPEEGVLRLTHVSNAAGFFGLLAPEAVFLVASVFVIGIALLLYFLWPFSRRILARLGFALLLGGAVGNQVDRLARGAVTDFIDFRIWGSLYWPTFNFADCAIAIGVALLGYSLLSQRKQAKAS